MVSHGEPSGPAPGFDIKSTLTTTMVSGRCPRPMIGMQAMTAPQTPADDTAAPVPVACSLTRAGLAAQAGRGVRLPARAEPAREQHAPGVRVNLRPVPSTQM